MDYFLYFIVFVILGCFCQCIASMLGMYALLRKRYDGAKFWAVTFLFSAILVIVRVLSDLDIIRFGIHTIIMLSCLILIGFFLLDVKNIFKVSISTIIIFALITISEVINVAILYLTIGKVRLDKILLATMDDINALTIKVLFAVPSNIILFIISLLLYMFLVKSKKQGEETNNNYDSFHEDIQK